MHENLQKDQQHLPELMQETQAMALQFLQSLPQRAAGLYYQQAALARLPSQGGGTRTALWEFEQQYLSGLSGSAGSRYLGFVTGGSTPAGMLGDWLTSVFDQNVASAGDSSANEVEYEALAMLRQLFGLPDAFQGTFVSGATMSGFTNLAIARQWWGQQVGQDIALEGMPTEKLQVLSGTPHSSIYKALSMLGIGRNSVQRLALLPHREAVDPQALQVALEALDGTPCIVVANAGTVNTVDFDEIEAICALRDQFPFWLHVDAAFGGFAACSPRYSAWLKGWEQADSITIDLHKMLNVPYDSAIQLSRHPNLQQSVFQNSGARYLEVESEQVPFVHLTPENSRRFRALPTWFSLKAYGEKGFQELVERNVQLARQLGQWVESQEGFELMATVRFNVCCFQLTHPRQTQQFLRLLTEDGRVFLTPSELNGIPCIRAAFSNWQTQASDLAIIQQALIDTYAKLSSF